MSVKKFEEAKKIWHGIAKHVDHNHEALELEFYKQLLNIFHIGPHYYFIFNCATAKIEYTSDAVKDILGYQNTEFTIDLLLNLIHPDDLPYFMAFENRVTQFFNALPPDKILNYKVSYDYRMRRKDGSYVRLLQQATTIQSDERGAVIRVLDVHTDISHLNKPQGSTLSFIGLAGEPSYHHVCSSFFALQIQKDILTRREKQVLKHIIQGKTSQEIAAELFISILTVNEHRKKLLKKTDSASTVELTIKAVQQNWVD
ncbi:LuxR C-terminal-related transcriptional regulator [Pedobacter duraquae]|uniref:PAS domain-containing protein n=1 Tax=Pedobacter duraquae TaxID=425511 RepID=A0A4R6IGW0_9SPHI|nr:LuxR C-terminal-related transcriptional regulator [Pedobacter duraquae]TDO20215.1 PAS domain-containing protein [Pedobacter duraquae]